MNIPILTRSEQQLVALCITHKTISSLAQALGVSPYKAGKQRLALYKLLGVKTRNQLFQAALREGMVTVRVRTLLPIELKD